MSNRHSSFRAEMNTHARSARCPPGAAPSVGAARPDMGAERRRSAWPWLLAAGPVAVVLASLATAWLAVSRDDGVVAENYYKLGLTINRRLEAERQRAPQTGATLEFGAAGDVRVRLLGPGVDAKRLRLVVRPPGETDGRHALALEPAPGGEFVGTLREVVSGRRIVVLEADGWRFPVTLVDHLPATIALGAPAAIR